MDNEHPYGAGYFERATVEKDARVLREIIRIARPRLRSDSRILDVGCATGRLLQELRQAGFTRLSGVDISSHAVEEARRSGLPDTFVGDLQAGLPLEGGTRDAVFMLDVIEHFTRPYDALIEARRLLRTGGTIVITTPNANSILRPLRGRHWALADDTHVFYFTEFSLGYLLKKCGFSLVTMRTRSYNYGPVGALLSATRMGGQLVAVALAR